MTDWLLTNEARSLLEKVTGTRLTNRGEGSVWVSFRRTLVYLGHRAPGLVRSVAEIPKDREPWEWCPDQAEESEVPYRLPYRAVLELAGHLAELDGNRWAIEPRDLAIALLSLAHAPLQPGPAALVEAVARTLNERRQGRPGGEGAAETTLEEDLKALAKEGKSGGASKDVVVVGPGKETRQRDTAECPTLESLGRDLTREAEEGKLPPVRGRDREIEAILETLCRVSKRNPLLVGPPGCGKTALAAGVAQRIASGQVPESLAGSRLMAVGAGDLNAGMMWVGSLEGRMKQIIEEASQPGILLFMDEIHLAVGAGASSKSDQDVANLLKPALADGRLALIGATTDLEIGRLERDGAFARRFQIVPIEELGREEALAALRSRAAFLTGKTGVAIEDRAVILAANLADRLIRHRVQPDKGIDVLERAVARAQMRGQASVDPALVREVLREMIGMPFQAGELGGRLRVMREVVEGLGLMDATTAGRLAERLQLTMLGLDVRPERPNAVILAAGPGESAEELARVLSEILLEREDVVRIDLPGGRDMVEERLLGRPAYGWKDVAPEYQRHLIQHPWSVVLVTGLDNADPKAVEILAGAMERGVLDTPANRRVPFADSIFVIAVANDPARAPGFSTGGDGGRAGNTALSSTLDRLGPRFAKQVDLACALAASTAGPGERWVRVRLLGPVTTRWEAETGVRVSFDRAVAAALAGAAGGEGMDMPRLTQVFEERVAAPLAPVLAGAPSGGRISVRLASAEPLEVRFSLSEPAAAEDDEEPEGPEKPDELEAPPA